MRSVEPVDHNTLPVPIAVRLAEGEAQVSRVWEAVMLSGGVAWSAVTLAVAVALQPLLPVRVTEYVPAAVAVIVWELAPVFHK
jgi:hypothetical protein